MWTNQSGPEVEDSGGTQLVYSPQGGRLGFMSGQTYQTGRVPLVAGAWARYLPSGLALYRHPDWLGSVRLSSTPSQTVYYDGAYAPYGESYAEWGATDHVFTGQKEDTVGDLYDFPFREYHATQGRWLRPDPAGLAAADLTNPQSLNRYAYVLNNPTGLVDPLGLDCKPGTANCKQPPECLGMVCADQYYGGEMFKGFTTFEMPICVITGVMGYCGQGALAAFMSPTGSDEFDIDAPPIQVGIDENGDPIYVYPGAGLYWAAEPGSAVIDSSGRTSTSTGTLGFSDLVWGEANRTTNILTGTSPSAEKQNEVEAAINGNYMFTTFPGSAASQSPGMTAFAIVPLDTLMLELKTVLPPALPGWWFTGQ